jgi:hypothetical protein
VARCPDGTISVRDSKNPDDAEIIISRGDWDAFLAGAKQGDFDGV